MARPARNALPGNILSSARTFFATTKTSQRRALLQSERNATLMIDVLRSYVPTRKYSVDEVKRVDLGACVLRHHQDQPRPRPVAVGAECHVDDRRASLLRSDQEIPASRLCRNARPSAFIGDGRRRHDGGKGHAVSQGRILIPLEEGMRSLGRGLAAWLLRDARGVSAELHEASGIHSGEPGEGGTGREARGVPLLFQVRGKEEGSGG